VGGGNFASGIISAPIGPTDVIGNDEYNVGFTVSSCITGKYNERKPYIKKRLTKELLVKFSNQHRYNTICKIVINIVLADISAVYTFINIYIV
jgi:hypothetical protein